MTTPEVHPTQYQRSKLLVGVMHCEM